MEIIELLTILKDGESTTIEFKESVTKDICRTVCAFANTKGGVVLVGVKDNGTPIGIKSKDAKQEVSNFLQTVRPMPQHSIELLALADTKILAIKVAESSVLVSVKLPLSATPCLRLLAPSRGLFCVGPRRQPVAS